MSKRSEIISLLTRVMNPEINRRFIELKTIDAASRNEVTEIQLSKLKYLLLHHLERGFYRSFCEQAGLIDFRINSICDLSRFPIVNKNYLRKNLRKIANTPDAFRLDSTSGSSGQNLFFYHSRETTIAKSAAIRYCFSLIGIEYWGDRKLTIWGNSPYKTHFQRVNETLKLWSINGRLLQGFGLDEKKAIEYLNILENEKPKVLAGYPSYLYIISTVGKKFGIIPYSPDVIVTSGEQLQEYQRDSIESYFETRIFNRYGSREFGVIAHETCDHNGMYVPPTRYILERDSNDELLITDLDNFATPFIRYAIGDKGYLTSAYHFFGKNGQRIENIDGRIHDILTTPSGKLIPGQYLTILTRKVSGIDDFQFVQEEHDCIKLRIMVGPEYQDINELKLMELKLMHLFKELAGDELRLEVIKVDKIEQTKMGKRRFIINLLNGSV